MHTALFNSCFPNSFRRRRARAARRLNVAAHEALESRRLLASVDVSRGVLRIEGNATNDVINVSKSGNQTVVAINGSNSSFNSDSFALISIGARAGDDKITISSALTVRTV